MSYGCKYCDGEYKSQSGLTRHLNTCIVFRKECENRSHLNDNTNINKKRDNIYYIQYNIHNQYTNNLTNNNSYHILNQQVINQLNMQLTSDKQTFKALESYIIGLLDNNDTQKYLSRLNKYQLKEFPRQLLSHIEKNKPNLKEPLKYIMYEEVDINLPIQCNTDNEKKYIQLLNLEAKKVSDNINNKIRPYITVEDANDIFDC